MLGSVLAAIVFMVNAAAMFTLERKNQTVRWAATIGMTIVAIISLHLFRITTRGLPPNWVNEAMGWSALFAAITMSFAIIARFEVALLGKKEGDGAG